MAMTTQISAEPLAPSTQQVYSTPKAAELAGVSYRQADHWERTRVLRPSGTLANGSGSARKYTPEDVQVLAVLRELSKLGAKIITLGLPTERICLAIERGDRWLIATPDAFIDSCGEGEIALAVESASTMGAWELD